MPNRERAPVSAYPGDPPASDSSARITDSATAWSLVGGGRERFGPWLAPALVVALTIAVFLPALRNDFVNWDDPKNFLDNLDYRGLGPRQLTWMFTSFHMGHYIPVTWMTLGLDYLIWGMNPAGYHLHAVLIHASTALALYFLSLRLLGRALPDTTESARRIGALAAALVFAVHPLRVESVAWVTERRDVVSGFFYILAALAYLKAVEGAERPRPRWYWGSVGLFACALLSKSIAVSLPVALLAMDVYPLRRLGGERGWRRWGVWLEKLPYLLLGAAAAVVSFFALFTLGNTRPLAEMGVLYRAVLSVYGLAFYLFKSALPIGLSPLYQLPVEVTWWHFATVLALLAVALVMRRRWPGFAAAAIVYAATLFPVLGTFQNGPQAAADRYTYHACLGWAVLVGGLCARSWRGRDVTRVVVAVWIGALLPLTWQQIGIWHDSVALWSRAVAISPQSRASHFNLAGAYENAGQYAAAVSHYEEVARLSPQKARWYITIGWNYEKAKVERLALEAFRKALALEPGLPDACEGVIRAATRLRIPPELPAGCTR